MDGVIEAQYRVAVLEKLVNHLINRSGLGAISQADLERFRREALEDMQKRYPDAGIKQK